MDDISETQPEVSAMSDRANASSRTDLLLAKAKPIRGGDSISGVTYLRSKKEKLLSNFNCGQRRVE